MAKPDNYDNDDYDLPSVPLPDLRLPGYKDISADFTKKELECGYCDEGGELDLNDMFGAFEVPNYGLVGGDRTVDDFTPEGLEDRSGSREMTEKEDRVGRLSGAFGSGTGQKRYP